jgi:hypothetical protein
MEKVKKNKAAIQKIFSRIIDGEFVPGCFIFRDMKIHISPIGGPRETQNALRNKRRSSGCCIVCGKSIKEKNPQTGKKYTLCPEHKKQQKTAGKKYYDKRRRDD